MMCLRVSTKLFLWICIADLCHSQEQFGGPFRVVVHQVDLCEDSGTHQLYINSTRINKVSRNKYLYSTNMTFEITINDDISGEVDFASFGNGGWKPHFFQVEFPHICTNMKQILPGYFDAILAALHTECPIRPGEVDFASFGNGGWKPHFFQVEFPHICTNMKQILPGYFDAILAALHTECPIRPGTYEVIDLELEKIKADPSLPNFPYGKYRVDYKARLNGTLIGCIRYFADAVPDKRRHNKPKKNS